MGKDKQPQLDLEPFNVNGVIHVGANVGEYADYYHKLGVNKVLWIEKDEYKYKDIYANTRQYAMDQKILICHLLDEDNPPLVKKFLTVWRENGSFIDMDTYDLLHIATSHERWPILLSFGYLLDFFKEIIITDDLKDPDPGQIAPLESHLGPKGFVLDTHMCSPGRNEFLFRRRG